jgi:NitT/TauT family transport system substrate-binding protein
MVRRWVPVLTSSMLAASMFALAACGGGDDAAGDAAASGSSGQLREVTVGMLPILPTAALYAGIDQGFFADHGIELTVQTGQGGAALLPAVLAGQMQFATSNPVSLLQAREKGIDVRVIAHWTSSLAEGDTDVNGVVAAADSGIESATDLAGRTVAVNTLSGMGGLTIRQAVRADGGDPDAVTFLELGFPDMPAALEAGRVDAVWVPEPFLTTLQDGGNKVVSWSSKESVPGHPTQMFFTSGQLVESDPELVQDMTAAVEETLQYAEANPDDVKAHVSEFLDLPAAVLDRVGLEAFGTDLRRDEIEQLGQLMVADGLLTKDADVDGLLPSE